MYATTPSVGDHGSLSANFNHDRYRALPERSLNVERVDEEARIRQILGAHLRLGAHVRVRQGRPDAEAQSVPRPLLDDEGLVWAAPLELPATVEVEAYNAIYRFTVDALCGPEGLRSSLPSTLVHVRQRWTRRVDLLPGDPLSAGELPLHDISYGGFSFVFDGRQEHFEPGEKLSNLCIDRDTHLDGVVRSVAGGASERALCRVQAAPRSAADEASWRALVDSRLHPQTRLGGAWSSELWSLYGACGYFGLSGTEPLQFNALKEAFVDVSRRLEGAREIGYHVVFPSRSVGAMAALSMLKVYSRSWLGFQMAKRKGDAPEGMTGRSILREIHLRAYEQAQTDRDLDWLIGYIQVKPVWSRLVHHDLPQRYVERGDASMTRFQAIEIASSSTEADADPTILPASSAEVELLCATLAKSRPRAYVEGLDLTPARLDLGSNVALWRSAGMLRERTTLVAREDGVAVAAAVVELGQDGAHLFRLLDLVRLYPLRSDAAAHYPRLLEAAGRWFGARGKPSFVLFREEGTEVDLAQIPVLKDMGFADMSILSAALLPELLEHVCEVTAPPN